MTAAALAEALWLRQGARTCVELRCTGQVLMVALQQREDAVLAFEAFPLGAAPFCSS